MDSNIYIYGAGNKEQSFYVDGIPIRQFNNLESRGVPYPKDQQMQIQCSLWEASDWATRGGHIKIDWSLAPFTASYRNFNVRASTWSRSSSCSNQPSSHKSWLTETLGR
ncbi:hypothetical protein RHGRI_004004 [Rhododendron griersonianum]|uniref:GH16 domain-containing protein n=1 Tax=Rhododendron griersonianum TaxID=479676 RepID=A0AAV6L701_9ERIC|nr:hypothetical protein RHGRI_004004 [Rhododendron griersonianum]